MLTKSKPVSFTLKHLDDGGMFEGYASVFGVVDSDGDVIVKGAFEESIQAFKEKGKRPKLLWMHNPSIIVGSIIDIFEDDKGLYMKGRLILEVEKGREAYALMKAGELDAMSVGFNVANRAEASGEGGIVISKADLWEVSIVTWGANPDAIISSVKSIDSKRDFERFLRESGFSKKQAEAITAKGFQPKATDHGEHDLGDDRGDPDYSKALEGELDKLLKTLKGDQNGNERIN